DADRVFQRAFRSPLNHRPVGHRVREWHTEFDHVSARIGERKQQTFSRRQIGIARGDIWDEGFAAFAFQPFKPFGNASHILGELGVGIWHADLPPSPTPTSPLPTPNFHFFPLYAPRQTFLPPSSTTSNDPSRIIFTPTGRPHTSCPDSSGTHPVRKFS